MRRRPWTVPDWVALTVLAVLLALYAAAFAWAISVAMARC